jgi:hypothetical protein
MMNTIVLLWYKKKIVVDVCSFFSREKVFGVATKKNFPRACSKLEEGVKKGAGDRRGVRKFVREFTLRKMNFT